MSTSAKKEPNLVSVTTINEDGSHYFLHPADVKGRFTMARRWFGWALIAIYIILPWIPINGFPAVFIDLINQRFHIFGLTLIPQDLWVFFFGLTGLGFGLFFLTALLGRLWCGWACPYTVFLEHVYRRIERWIDGDAQKRKKLATGPWNVEKIFKRSLKYSLYLLASALLAHIFLAYFVSIPELWKLMAKGPAAHPISFGVVAFFTTSFYFCFAWFREQFCIIVCPYGRLQSALTDDDTMVIGYDERRGEPRGKAKTDTHVGDCIDCHRCVQVCPTGIDIRNGLQLECIGCAACIDACDDIMRKLNRPTGLVRYDSSNGLEQKPRRWIRPRIFLYGVLAAIGLTVFSTVFYFKASPYFVHVYRTRNVATYVDDDVSVRNQFNVTLINKRARPVEMKVFLASGPESARIVGDSTHWLDAQGEMQFKIIVEVPASDYRGPGPLIFGFTSSLPGKLRQIEETFLGPPLYRYQEKLAPTQASTSIVQ